MFRTISLFRLIMVSFSTIKSIGYFNGKYFIFKTVPIAYSLVNKIEV